MTGITPADVLDKAADILDERGWCRHTYTNHVTGHHCAVGAIRAAADALETEMRDGWYVDAFRASVALTDDVGSTVQYWNDHVVKDKRQVTRAMRRVAKKLRGQ